MFNIFVSLSCHPFKTNLSVLRTSCLKLVPKLKTATYSKTFDVTWKEPKTIFLLSVNRCVRARNKLAKYFTNTNRNLSFLLPKCSTIFCLVQSENLFELVNQTFLYSSWLMHISSDTIYVYIYTQMMGSMWPYFRKIAQSVLKI